MVADIISNMKKTIIILLFFLTSCITVRVVHECECDEEQEQIETYEAKPYKPGAPGFWLVEPVKTEN